MWSRVDGVSMSTAGQGWNSLDHGTKAALSNNAQAGHLQLKVTKGAEADGHQLKPAWEHQLVPPQDSQGAQRLGAGLKLQHHHTLTHRSSARQHHHMKLVLLSCHNCTRLRPLGRAFKPKVSLVQQVIPALTKHLCAALGCIQSCQCLR